VEIPRRLRPLRLTRRALAALVGALVLTFASWTGSTGAAPVAAPIWPSGAYLGTYGNQAVADQFAAYRGRDLSIVGIFPERSTWDALRNDTWGVEQYAGFPGRLSIAVPLLPTDESTTLGAIADGSHDNDFTQLARNLVALKRGDSDIRLGWEFNGDWYRWSAWDPQAYIAAYRRVAQIFRRESPAFTLNWNGNAVESACGHDPFLDIYPGDDVVDVVGVDAYDWAANGITDSESFARWRDLPHGISAWLSFARAHHKLFAVPEWGVVGGDHGQGDNPAYIEGMYKFFRQNRGDLAYEAYFNQKASLANSLIDPVQMPASSATYAALWSRDSA
jgi:hypothetical protein